MTDFGKRLGEKYYDRGDPDSWDFNFTDFITDGAWHPLDLSSILPLGASVALLRLLCKDNAVESTFYMSLNGKTEQISVASLRMQVADVFNSGVFLVPCDSDRLIQYVATNTTFTDIRITVIGWFK